MSASMIVFWALVIGVVFLLIRGLNRPLEHGRTRSMPAEILGDRLTRGEIDEEEYRRRLNALRTGSGQA
ncbi:SHOCT domain-containing protein [Streptomyces sp. NPDC019396]|uniref:SHOCT domain-containing protein n=1 Tax=Streptomyces sp. NPDC019396 TaxID=3154687 RepID=UPI003403793E